MKYHKDAIGCDKITIYGVTESNSIMTQNKNLKRRNLGLADFLKSRRALLSLQELGLPQGNRRRTQGLRREEVATLAGVGLSWYTWLEQGRDISVSVSFLNRLSELFCLSHLEKEHLFILAQNRQPEEEGTTNSEVPMIIKDMMSNLTLRPCYAWNLKWDIIAWNQAADAVFKFSSYQKHELNFIWLLFTKQHMQDLILNWENQAEDILSSFRRDFARTQNAVDANILIYSLKDRSNDFARLWDKQQAHAPCKGIRNMQIDPIGKIKFRHATLIISNRDNLKLTYYKAVTNVNKFDEWVIANSQLIENKLGSGLINQSLSD